MMMKLMKFLVIALVAGGVCAPVASQAGEADGKAIMCTYVKNLSEKPYTNEEKAEGKHLQVWHFGSDQAYRSRIDVNKRPRVVLRRSKVEYWTSDWFISWYYQPRELCGDSCRKFQLDRKTLQLEDSYFVHGKQRFMRRHAQCELIDPIQIDTYFQPYIDYGNALDEKVREGNKI